MKQKFEKYLEKLINRDFPIEEWNSEGGKNLYFSDGTRYFFGKKEWKMMRKLIEKTITKLEKHIENLNNEDFSDQNYNE